jgi:hypothetical protein
MALARILLQLDVDPQPSVFDSVVAIDAGAEQLLRVGGVTADNVRDRIYGAMFTRGPADLHSTAIFIGGSDAAEAEAVLRAVQATFFGPLRVSILLDPNGANTTAAAAVLAAERHAPLAGAMALVLGATGPVGARAVRLLAQSGSRVRAGSRTLEKAQRVCREVSALVKGASLEPVQVGDDASAKAALSGAQIVISAGTTGAKLLSARAREESAGLRVAIDLNAVPPLGLEGIEATDRGTLRAGAACYGALGVGGTKMKIHKAAIAKLFEKNDQVFDAEELLELGRGL